MCGISGIISSGSFSPGDLAAMTSAVRHRGPDEK